MRYGFVIDKKLCHGCHTCCVACKMENNLPNDVWWNRAHTDGGDTPDTPKGTYPQVTMSYNTVACQHCSNPACLAVCPTGATSKDEATGIVLVDETVCIGCDSCIAACPYQGVRTHLEKAAFATDVTLGASNIKEHVEGTVEKCTMCFHRLAFDEKPACVEVCPARARFWGDLDDPESDPCKAMEGRETMQLLADEGTEPNVYYLV